MGMHPALDRTLGAAGRYPPRHRGNTGAARRADCRPGSHPAGGGVGLGTGKPPACRGSSIAAGSSTDDGTDMVTHNSDIAAGQAGYLSATWTAASPGVAVYTSTIALPPTGSMA